MRFAVFIIIISRKQQLINLHNNIIYDYIIEYFSELTPATIQYTVNSIHLEYTEAARQKRFKKKNVKLLAKINPDESKIETSFFSLYRITWQNMFILLHNRSKRFVKMCCNQKVNSHDSSHLHVELLHFIISMEKWMHPFYSAFFFRWTEFNHLKRRRKCHCNSNSYQKKSFLCSFFLQGVEKMYLCR